MTGCDEPQFPRRRGGGGVILGPQSQEAIIVGLSRGPFRPVTDSPPKECVGPTEVPGSLGCSPGRALWSRRAWPQVGVCYSAAVTDVSPWTRPGPGLMREETLPFWVQSVLCVGSRELSND